MPCTDGSSARELLETANQQSSKLEGLLCEACNLLGREGMRGASKDLRRWWKRHRAEDQARQAAADEQAKLEQLADRAIGRLSTEEVEALRHTGQLNPRRRR